MEPKQRPGFGTLGRSIKLLANHYKIVVPEKGCFYHYDVDIKLVPRPHEKGAGHKKGKENQGDAGNNEHQEAGRINKDLKRKIWRLFVEISQGNPVGLLYQVVPAFDGERNMYTMKKLNIPPGGNSIAEITVPADADGGERRAIVTIQPCVPLAIDWAWLARAVAGEAGHDIHPAVVIQCINTVFREAAMAVQNRIAVGRSFYWRHNPRPLGPGTECWSGFFSSARPNQWKITLNLDVANSAFYKAQPVLVFLEELEGGRNFGNFNEQRRLQFEREMKGVRVEFRVGDVVRRYRVAKLSPLPASHSMFQHEGAMISVENYFATHHHRPLQYPRLPCLEVGQRRTWLPMELCRILEQKVQRKLNEAQTAAMVKLCSRPANERLDRVRAIRGGMNYEASDVVNEFRIRVAKNLEQLDGRVLPKPVMGQGGPGSSVTSVDVKSQDGTWEQGRFLMPKDLLNWMVVCLSGGDAVDHFVDALVQCGEQRGMQIARPEDYGRVERNPDFRTIFREIQDKNKNKPLQLIMVILGTDPGHYAEIKKAGDVQFGVPTQCILSKSIFNADRKGRHAMSQLAGNVLLKINVKLEGANSQVLDMATNLQLPGQAPGQPSKPNPSFKAILKRFVEVPTIVFGLDVTHPSPGESASKPSIAALVGSFNRTFNRYSARVRAQAHRREIVTDLQAMVVELLQEFLLKTKVKPERIIFYRDGVSEGQYLEVLQEELSAVQGACKQLELDYKPAITYIIVGKRHHTRLFAANPKETAGRANNVPPGTMTDLAICHYREFDFFLCSHAGIQGTSRPAHYNVLYDDMDFSADEIQLFSYYLAYVYARCNRSVSIPAPVYYAHHVAFRARHHLEDRNAVEPAGQNPRQPIPPAEIQRMNQRIRIHDNLKGMYFA